MAAIVDESEVNLLREGQSTGLYEKAFEVATKFASTGVGQLVVERVDRVFKVLEETAKWSLPHDQHAQTSAADKSAPSPIQLVRPLPWIPFLLTIALLRGVRTAVSVAAILIGNNPVSAADMVYFIQTRRRKLRSIKIRGLRAIRTREEQQKSSDKANGGLIAKLTSLLTIVVCRPGAQTEPSTVRVVVRRPKKPSEEGKNKEKLHAETSMPKKKPSLAEEDEEAGSSSDDELTVSQMLDKYANMGSEIEDEDFEPGNVSGDETSTTTTDDETENENLETLNDSVHIQTNGNGDVVMPKPIPEIKKETHESSDVESKQHNSEDDATPAPVPVVAAQQNGTSKPKEATEKTPAFNSKKPLKGSPDTQTNFDSVMARKFENAEHNGNGHKEHSDSESTAVGAIKVNCKPSASSDELNSEQNSATLLPSQLNATSSDKDKPFFQQNAKKHNNNPNQWNANRNKSRNNKKFR